MVYAQSSGVPVTRNPLRERATLTIAGSVALHLAVGWLVIDQLVARVVPEPGRPMVIEIAPPIARPAPAAPEVTPDRPETLAEPVRSELAPPRPETPPPAPASADPAPPSPVVAAGPAAPSAQPAPPPAAAPSPTYRAPMTYPARAETAQRAGVAVVEILVGEGGGVTDLSVISEMPTGYGFGAAAVDSIRKWRFETAQPGIYRVTVKFKLD